ncbi:MAG: acetoin utilization protein AcuC [Longimicrobiales bacterium]
MWDDAFASYSLGAGHPLDPERLRLTVDLLRRLRLVGADAVVLPRPATDEELGLVHDPAYIQAVIRLSAPAAATDYATEREAQRWGIGTGDVPIAPNMDTMARHTAGATLTAAELVMGGRCRRAFQPAGGLHHAHRARAAGFCVYNDLAVAIEWLRRQHHARVLYIDYDAHHGDGVQELFYEADDVLTISLHESGAFLFPGTGFVHESGSGAGVGYALNLPLEPYSQDGSFYECFEAIVPQAAEAFRPDVIVLQNGCDSHWLDPLTHLACSTRLYERLVRLTCELADRWCEGRIIATGGGGYAVHEVVPRAWTLVWAVLAGIEAPDRIPEEWRAEVRARSGATVPPTLRDPEDAVPTVRDAAGIAARNRRTAADVRERILPLLSGWGLAF